MTGVAIVLIVLGFFLLGFGNRLAILGAGVGALLGVTIVSILPGEPGIWLWVLVPFGLAILFAVGSGLAKAMINLVTLALGALAGGAVILALLNLFGLDWGFTNWILALIGAVIGAGLMVRFKTWAVIILAAIVGSLLVVNGLQTIFPSFNDTIASLVGLALVGLGIAYMGGLIGKKK
jgi:hypothetical protein